MRGQPLYDVVRHRLLEAFLERLVLAPDAAAFTLRGGMLVRHWFPNVGRFATDLDLVCALPYDENAMRTLIRGVLSRSRCDGVSFEFERFRLDSIWTDTPHPGLRLFASALVDGRFDEVHVDFTFSMPIFPKPLSTRIEGARLWVCPPSMLIARKLRVTAELGDRFWRPKDLADLWLLLRHQAPSTHELGEAIERTFDEPQPFEHLSETLASQHWTAPHACGRWRRFASRRRGLQVPRDVGAVIGEVRSRLAVLR